MKRILIIKADERQMKGMADILRLSGYKVFTLSSPTLALENLDRLAPDLILCDLVIRNRSGYDLLEKVRSSAQTELIPFILLGNSESLSEARLSMTHGADDYLGEPISSVDLLDTVATRLKKSGQPEMEKSPSSAGLEGALVGSRILDRMSHGREVRRYGRRELILTMGDQVRYFYVIQMGRVKIFKSNPSGKALVTDIYKSGDYFGIESLVFEMPSSTNAMALENSQLLLIPRQVFMTTLMEDPYFAALIVKQLASSIQFKERRMLSIAYDSVRKRIAETLLSLTEAKGNEIIQIQREDISNLVGTAKESVSRILSEFRAAHIIEISSGRINILQRDKLANIMC